MSKKTIPFDMQKIEELVGIAEKEQVFSGLSHLFEKVAELYRKADYLNADRINAGVVGLRIKTHHIPHKTTIGKRGNALGKGPPRTNNEERVLSPANVEHFKKLKKYIIHAGFSRSGERSTPRHKNTIKLVDKIEKGSLRAAIDLACMECTNFQPAEIKHCQCNETCPLFSVRPYQ